MSPLLAALLGLAPALAVTPGGWRVQAAVPETSIALRPVAVLFDPVGDVTQLTADVRIGLGEMAFDAQLPWVQAEGTQGDWSSSAPGNLRMGLYRWHFHQHFQVGVEWALPVVSQERAARSWASLASEALPGAEVLPVFQTLWATERFNVTARAGVGLRWGPYVTPMFSGDTPTTLILDLAGALTVTITEHLGFVGEGELLVDRVPLTTRLLLRTDLPVGQGFLAFDVGLQLPLIEEADGAENGSAAITFQPIAQVRWYPRLDWPWPGTHPDSPSSEWHPDRSTP